MNMMCKDKSKNPFYPQLLIFVKEMSKTTLLQYGDMYQARHHIEADD